MKGKKKGQPAPGFEPHPSLAEPLRDDSARRAQDDRIEQGLADFVEAFLQGTTSIVVEPIGLNMASGVRISLGRF